jgi:hypothetical protein
MKTNYFIKLNSYVIQIMSLTISIWGDNAKVWLLRS